MKSQTGFPVIENDGAFRIVEVHTSKRGKVTHKQFAFCNLATPEQNEAGIYGLVEYHSGTREQCIDAAQFASRMTNNTYLVTQHTMTGWGCVVAFRNGNEIA